MPRSLVNRVLKGHLLAVFSLALTGCDGQAEIDRQWALKQASIAECVVERSQTEEALFLNLGRSAQAVFNLGDTDRAHLWSELLLGMASGREDHWNYGNAIYEGHAMLGRIALVRGDRQLAKDHLLAAGLTTGSPQLNSFGPNVALARDLLAVGERDTVLAYFDQCEWFWEMGHDELSEWRRTISSGNMPDFGANLEYW